MDGVCRQTGGHSGPARSAQRAYLCPPLPARRGSRVVSASMPGRRETLLGTLSAVAAASGASGAAGAAAQLTSTGTVPGTRPRCPPPPTEVDSNGIERLVLQPQGWETWSWRGHKINFLAAGSSGPAVVLVHGFGASVYHWRYNVPALAAAGCRVYALDLLGFGWSEKPLADYQSYGLWKEQIADFVKEVVGPGERVTLVGNSLGGYNSLAAAADHPELVSSLVLLNAAGRFEADSPAALQQQEQPEEEEEVAAQQGSVFDRLWAEALTAVKRGVVFGSFLLAKQPARIRQVLRQVYVSDSSIDDDLVASITLPASDPNAPEVFYRVITGRGQPMNRLLARLALARTPVLLLWGAADPWCVPARATQIQLFYPAAQRVDLPSGHCPHDDTPAEFNAELLRWVKREV